jgi:hypothetical protein
MSLQTFEQVRPWARSIRERVLGRQMPPWHIDKTVGVHEFKNDRSLSDDEIATIVKWVDAGAPQGNPNDMPPPKTWPDGQGWNYAARFGEPDLLIRSTPWTQKAGANDTWWKPVVPSGVTEPRWVRAIEIRPTTLPGRKITHHAIAYLEQSDPGGSAPAGLPAPFMEWAVGKQGEMMRPDTGKLLLPGSKFHWDIHYSQAGEEITSNVELGLYFYPKGQEPKFRTSLALVPAALGQMDVRPNAVTISQSFTPLRESARVESFQAHMHLRGKAMMLEAILPTGQTQVLSYVNDFNFNWHNSYVYKETAAPLLPKGTIIKVTAWHDNTAANKANPDPNVWVGYGDRTVDEMAHAWMNVVYLDDAEYKDLVARRKGVGVVAAAASRP